MSTTAPMAAPEPHIVYTSKDESQYFRYTGEGFSYYVWRGSATGWWVEGPINDLKNSPIDRELGEQLRQKSGDMIHVADNWYLVWNTNSPRYRFELRPVPDKLPSISMVAPVTIILTMISPPSVQEYLLSTHRVGAEGELSI